MQPLGRLPDQRNCLAFGVSDDGESVVGSCYTSPSRPAEAFLWTASNGMRSLQSVLEGYGVELANSNIAEAPVFQPTVGSLWNRH